MFAELDDAPEWMSMLTGGPKDVLSSSAAPKDKELQKISEVEVPEDIANEGDAAALLLAVKDRLTDKGDGELYQTFLEAVSQDPVDYGAAANIVAGHDDLMVLLERCYGVASEKADDGGVAPEEPLQQQRGSAARLSQLSQLLFTNTSGHEVEHERVLKYAKQRSTQAAPSRRLFILRGPRGLGKSTWAENDLVEKVPEAAADLFASKLAHVCSADDFCMQFKDDSSSEMQYVFDPKSSGANCVNNEARVRLAMEAGIEPLYVDNTNMTLWEMRPYVILADRMGYDVTVVPPHEISTSWAGVDYLASRNEQSERQRAKRITQQSLEDSIQSYEDIVGVDAPVSAIRAAERPVEEESDATDMKMLIAPSAALYKFEKLLLEGDTLMRYVPPDGKGWGVNGQLTGEWPAFHERGDGSCQYDEGGGGPKWYTGDPESSWSFADLAMLEDLKKQSELLPEASLPSARSHPALFKAKNQGTKMAPRASATTIAKPPLSEPVQKTSTLKRKLEEDEEEDDVPAMSRKERFKQRVLMKVKQEEKARSSAHAEKPKEDATPSPFASKAGVPTSQEETSAATFLAAVKSRLTEWGKLSQYHEFVVALSGSIDARAAVRILRGHDDLLQVFKSKFAPRADLAKIKSELEDGVADEQQASRTVKQEAESKKRAAPIAPPDDGPHAPAGPPPRLVKQEMSRKGPVKTEIGKKAKTGVKKEAGVVKTLDEPRPPSYSPHAPRSTVTIGDDSDDDLPDEASIAVATRKGRNACIAELAKIIFYQERAAHQGARPRLEMVRYATQVASRPRFPRELFILRGPPGIGKSEYAMQQIESSLGADAGEARAMRLTHVCAMDDFFEKFGPDGIEYKFKASRLDSCHIRNEARARLAMEAGIHPLYVDCPNLKLWEMKPYTQLAERLGYVVTIVDASEINEQWDKIEYLVSANNSPTRLSFEKVVSRGALKPLLQAYEPVPDSEDPVEAVRSAAQPMGEPRLVEATPMPPEPRPSMAAHKKGIGRQQVTPWKGGGGKGGGGRWMQMKTEVH